MLSHLWKGERRIDGGNLQLRGKGDECRVVRVYFCIKIST